MIGRLCLFSFLHEGKKRVMKKQLRNLMKIYKKAEEDYELEARKTFTEYLKKQLKKSVKGEDRKKKRCIIEDYEVCCSSYLQAKFIEFNTSVAAVFISLLAIFISIVNLQEIQNFALTPGVVAVLIIALIAVIGVITTRLHRKEIKVREILLVVQKIKGELEEKDKE